MGFFPGDGVISVAVTPFITTGLHRNLLRLSVGGCKQTVLACVLPALSLVNIDYTMRGYYP